jgi:hypothetical protein
MKAFLQIVSVFEWDKLRSHLESSCGFPTSTKFRWTDVPVKFKQWESTDRTILFDKEMPLNEFMNLL